MPADLAPFVVTGEAGAIIFAAGDPATHVYFIQRGRIELTTERGGLSRTETLGMGDFFGESALVDDQPRTATARALTPFAIVRLDRATFRQVALAHPEVPLRMLCALAARERERPLVPLEASRATAAESVSPADARRAAPISRVLLVHGPSTRRFAIVAPSPATIGRLDRQTGFTPEVDLTDLDVERTLSRRHAVITWRDGACFVREDKATRNGTYVNGTRIETGVDVELHDGDRLRCGLVELEVHVE